MSGVPQRVLARYLLKPVQSRTKTAAFSPPSDQNSNDATGAKRNIPKDHEFEAKALKPLAQALWASTVALGHTLTAHRHLSRIKSATISPDGHLGGRGYVMKLADMRQKLYEASEALSAISDTIHDELNAPHWKPKLAQLDESDQEDVSRFVEEARDVMDDPEADAEEESDEIESKSEKKDKNEKEAEGSEDSSNLPTADASQAESAVHEQPLQAKQASLTARPLGLTDRQWVHEFYGNPGRYNLEAAIYVPANSSIPVSELAGPRVDHIGPGTGQGEFGEFNEPEPSAPAVSPEDDLLRSAGSWKDPINLPSLDSLDDYPKTHGPTPTLDQYREVAELLAKGWSEARVLQSPLARKLKLDKSDLNDARLMLRNKLFAAAAIPDSVSDDTPTDADDFGLGYGARGEGVENGKSVSGPHSRLPGSLAQSKKSYQHAYDALYGVMPGDVAGDIARSDYFPEAKDNMVSVGTSELPTPEEARRKTDQPSMNTHYVVDDVTDYGPHTPLERGHALGQFSEEPFASAAEATR